MRSPDTTPEAHQVQTEVYRRMTPDQRVRLAVQMSEDVMAMAADGVRARHPDYDEETVAWAVKRLRLADDVLFRKVWPAAPLVPS